MFSLLIPLHALTRLNPAGRQASKRISRKLSPGLLGTRQGQTRPLVPAACSASALQTAQGQLCLPHKPHGSQACPLIPLAALSPPAMGPGSEGTTVAPLFWATSPGTSLS